MGLQVLCYQEEPTEGMPDYGARHETVLGWSLAGGTAGGIHPYSNGSLWGMGAPDRGLKQLWVKLLQTAECLRHERFRSDDCHLGMKVLIVIVAAQVREACPAADSGWEKPMRKPVEKRWGRHGELMCTSELHQGWVKRLAAEAAAAGAASMAVGVHQARVAVRRDPRQASMFRTAPVLS